MKFTELNKALNDFGKYVVQQARSILTKEKKGGGDLYNSIDYNLIEEKDAFLLDFIMEEYGIFQDQGVKGANPSLVKNGIQKAPMSRFSYKSKMPPMKPLMQWAKKKNLRWRDAQGRFVRGNYRTLGFWLQKRVFAQGLKPTYFFTKPFQRAFDRLPPELTEAFALDIEKEIILGIKK
jgi:hypothetical protein